MQCHVLFGIHPSIYQIKDSEQPVQMVSIVRELLDLHCMTTVCQTRFWSNTRLSGQTNMPQVRERLHGNLGMAPIRLRLTRIPRDPEGNPALTTIATIGTKPWDVHSRMSTFWVPLYGNRSLSVYRFRSWSVLYVLILWMCDYVIAKFLIKRFGSINVLRHLILWRGTSSQTMLYK